MAKETPEKLISFLLDRSALREPQARDVKALLSRTPASDLRHVLIGGGFIEPERLAIHEAEYYNFPYIDLRGARIEEEARTVLPLAVVEELQVFCFEKMGQKLKIALARPDDNMIKQTLNDWAIRNQYELEYYLCSLLALDNALGDLLVFLRDFNEPEAELAKEMSNDKPDFIGAPTDQIISLLLGQAIKNNASHVHFSTNDDVSVVKMRINGALERAVELPREIHTEVVRELLGRGALDAKSKVPQVGFFEHNQADNNYYIKVSSFPSEGGQVMLQIVDGVRSKYDFPKLGFSQDDGGLIELALDRESGLILVVGPDSSGRSTTLSAMLDYLRRKNKNITTLEDTIEQVLPGVSHVQIRPELNFTFDNGLRALLRHDQDVIMIGEIRDHATAEMAIHAAMTGHLILASLTADDALVAISKLLKYKIEPFLLAATLNLLVAQRLFERNCPACSVRSGPPRVDESSRVEVGSSEGKTGCEICNFSGVKGKSLVAEVLPITENIARLISEGADISLLKKEVRKMPLKQMA